MISFLINYIYASLTEKPSNDKTKISKSCPCTYMAYIAPISRKNYNNCFVFNYRTVDPVLACWEDIKDKKDKTLVTSIQGSKILTKYLNPS